MTTYVSASTQYYGNMDTDAKWRVNGLATQAAILGAGLIQTADTGQINWVTSTKPGVQNTDGGFEMYRFNDSRQGVDPLFVKVFYGLGPNPVTRYRLRVQTGQGSDGAGNLTGQVSVTTCIAGGFTTSDGLFPNYACHTEGYFMLFNAMGCVNGAGQRLAVTRTKNALGAFDGVGNIIWADGGTLASCSSLAFTRTGSNPFAGLFNNNICMVPGLPASSALLNGEFQSYPIWYADPAVTQLWSMFVVNQGPFASTPTTFLATPFAAQTKTFMFAGNTTGTTAAPVAEVTSNATYRLAVLWE
jgi:hypothetical protein